MGPLTPPAWTEHAVCAQTDPEAFFPDKGVNGRTIQAVKDICGSCEAREQCLKAALENNERHGIWGGLTERERRKLVGRARTCRAEDCGKEFVPGSSHAAYCSDECRRTTRSKKLLAQEKAYGCIQCGEPATALRCSVCIRRHQAEVQPRQAGHGEAA